MKNLSTKDLLRRKLVLAAITDYFNEKIPQEQFERINKAVKANSTLGLDEEDRKAVWLIRGNLEDPEYMRNLQESKNAVAN